MKSSKCLILGGLAATAIGGIATIISKLRAPDPDGTAEHLQRYTDMEIGGFTYDQVNTFMDGMIRAHGSFMNGTDYKLMSVDAREDMSNRFLNKYGEASQMIADHIMNSGASS